MKRKYYLQLLEDIGEVKRNKPFNTKRIVLIAMLKKSINGEVLTLADYIALVNCVHISALTGKLDDFYSISSSVAENPICKARAKNKCSICHECYAAESVGYRSNLRLALLINHIIMNCFDIPADAWKVLSIPSVNGKARIESHGDVASVTASDNVIKIIVSHEWLTFGVWTKNHGFYYRSFLKYGKPGNMIFLVSSDKLNTPVELPENIKPYVNHVFTVYTFEYVKVHNINIQCGYHQCKSCLLCYTIDNNTFYVNEILKADTKRYKAYMGIE